MTQKAFDKLCEVLTDKIEGLEFVASYREKQINELKEENKKLKEENEKLKGQKQAVTDFVDRTKASIEMRVKGG